MTVEGISVTVYRGTKMFNKKTANAVWEKKDYLFFICLGAVYLDKREQKYAPNC